MPAKVPACPSRSLSRSAGLVRHGGNDLSRGGSRTTVPAGDGGIAATPRPCHAQITIEGNGVCAMSPSSDTLSKALQELAAASAQGAPPELGVRLRGAFARHHSRRRRKRVALIAGSVV